MCRVFDVEEGARASMQRARGEREPSVVRSVTSVAALPLKAPLAVGGLALNALNNVAAMAGMGMPDMGAMAAGLGRGGKSTKTSSVKKKFKQRKKRK